VGLGAADALTLLRAWLVPAIAGRAEPTLLLLGALSDLADGRVARATRRTRLGRDLEGLVNACFSGPRCTARFAPATSPRAQRQWSEYVCWPAPPTHRPRISIYPVRPVRPGTCQGSRPLRMSMAEYLHGRADRSQLGDYYLRDGMRVEAPGRWAAAGLGRRRSTGPGVRRAACGVDGGSAPRQRRGAAASRRQPRGGRGDRRDLLSAEIRQRGTGQLCRRG